MRYSEAQYVVMGQSKWTPSIHVRLTQSRVLSKF